MLSIINHKIIIEQGDSCAFRIIILDSNRKQIILPEHDILTIRIRRRDNPKMLLEKFARRVLVNVDNSTELGYVFRFHSEDTMTLPYGDYIYDVILEHSTKRFTLVSASTFTVKKTASLTDVVGPVIFHDEDDTDLSFLLSPTPLITRFDYINYSILHPEEDEEDDLILF